MNVIGILSLLAGLGLLITAIGRWMILAETRHLGIFSRAVICLVPLADVLFLARHWETARAGVFTGLFGAVLMLPYAGKKAWDAEHAAPQTTVNLKGVDGDQRDTIFMTLKYEHEARVERQTAKVQKLSVNLGAWYQRMEGRRPTLTTAEEIAAFNVEAAEYQALNAEAREQAAQLVALQSKHYGSWSELTDAEILEYLHRPKAAEKPARFGQL